MMLRHADGQRRRDQATDGVTHALGDKLCIKVISADQPIWPVLLSRADRDDDAARSTQIIFHLLPSGQRELHGSSPVGRCILHRFSAIDNLLRDAMPSRY